jgi:hypothetical protein
MAKKKKGLVGRNDILFYFEILFFDTANPDTTADPIYLNLPEWPLSAAVGVGSTRTYFKTPLAVTMFVLSTGRCISWKISVTVMIRW